MAPGRTYPVTIMQRLEVENLATITDEEADRGENDGLQGNQQYRDLRGVSWEFVAEALAREAALFRRFEAAPDIEAEAEAYLEELEDAVFPEEDLWGLDIGVIGAVLALSAMGAVTVSSCNAGGFGGGHVERYPLVVFFLPERIAADVVAIAQEADVGLDMYGGLARLFGRTDYDLHRFAEVAFRRHTSA